MPATVQREKSFNTMKSTVDTSHIRRSMLNDVEHLVVPIVALVEGVLHSGNSPHPELALASEFGKFPTSWNGRPVTLDHPQRDDQFVSASASPDVYEEEYLGILFNTRLDGKKLKTEAWINLDKVANASQKVKDEVDRLEKGEVVEVSTGLFTMAEAEHGKFNSKEYHAVWREIVPDHLAILPLGIVGACSVADGCGARVNMKTNCSCQDHDKDPQVNEENGQDNKKPKVNGEKDGGEDGDENTSIERTKFLSGLREKFAGIFKLAGNSAAGELSDMDTRAAIKAALKLEEDYGWAEVVAVFRESFIYAPGWDGTLYERAYSISSKGDVDLGADKTRVRPETTFVPVTITEETRMNKKEKVDALIANSATQFAEGDREWLDKQDEAVLDKLAPVVNAEDTNNGQSSKTETKTEKTVAESAKDDAAGQQPNTNAAPKTQTVEEYIAAAPVQLQAVLSSGLRAQQAKIDGLVKGIMANKQNQYTEAELRTMAEPMLEKLAKIAQVPDYSGQAGGSITANSENRVPEAPKLFPVKQA